MNLIPIDCPLKQINLLDLRTPFNVNMNSGLQLNVGKA